MPKLSRAVSGELSTDETLRRAKKLTGSAAKALPSAIAKYLVDKVPIVRWLPTYSPKWLLNDIIAGITIGVLLIPQALAYAKIATISGEFGLMSSWLPPLLYAVMGTSKDLSSGPTSIMGLLTAEIIADFIQEGYKAQTIAGVVTFVVGIYSLLVGLLKLGFVLDFISIPVLSGFVSAAGITIMLGQIPALFGETGVRSGTSNILYDFFTKLPQTKWLTLVIGFSGILLVTLMQMAGKRWGKQYRVIWIISICRNAIVLVIFTSLSFGLNKDLKKPLFDVSNISKTSIKPPVLPSMALVQKVSSRCLTVFIAMALEHLAIAKSFGRRHGYTIDESQELVFLGVSNLFNGFFFTMPTGGAFSRTAVNSESGVKSPLGGIVTAGFVVLSIYFLTGALFWIPKATLSAIILTAVWQILIPVSTFYRYWRTSLPDFTASMISFWVTLFVSVEMGIAFAVSFSILHLLLRTAFARLTTATPATIGSMYPSAPKGTLPSDTQIFRFTQSMTFPNAARTKTALLTHVKIYSSGNESFAQEKDKSEMLWSEAGQNKETEKLRSRAKLAYQPIPLRYVILDLENVDYIDTTGLEALQEAKNELRAFAGKDLELRFVGLNDLVRTRFEMSGWRLIDAEEIVEDVDNEKRLMGEVSYEDADQVFSCVQHAVLVGRRSKY
ncbi:sulfate transporter family-domain-containing protein [Tricladium varicosporioides]|nr:sulfate transporter family-domain-containing protein [Hymenoscyphus varicosporioides]